MVNTSIPLPRLSSLVKNVLDYYLSPTDKLDIDSYYKVDIPMALKHALSNLVAADIPVSLAKQAVTDLFNKFFLVTGGELAAVKSTGLIKAINVCTTLVMDQPLHTSSHTFASQILSTQKTSFPELQLQVRAVCLSNILSQLMHHFKSSSSHPPVCPLLNTSSSSSSSAYITPVFVLGLLVSIVTLVTSFINYYSHITRSVNSHVARASKWIKSYLSLCKSNNVIIKQEESTLIPEKRTCSTQACPFCLY
jgi:hypothetical protein